MITQIYTPRQLLARVRQLPEFTPQSGGIPWPRAYSSHREHWISWLCEQDMTSDGFYGRREPCRDAKQVYQRIQNVGMVIWINEAAGVEPGIVHGAVLRSQSARGNVANQTGAARRVLPWMPLATLIFR